MRRVLLSGLVAFGCGATGRGDARAPIAPESSGITLNCAAEDLGKYGVVGVSTNNPRFGALTTTVIIDGHRYYYGVTGKSFRRKERRSR